MSVMDASGSACMIACECGGDYFLLLVVAPRALTHIQEIFELGTRRKLLAFFFSIWGPVNGTTIFLEPMVRLWRIMISLWM